MSDDGPHPDAPSDDGDAPLDGALDDQAVLPGDVNPADRFTHGRKTVDLPGLVRASMGDLATRTPADPQPQPEPQPFPVVWRARRPVDNPAEADYNPDDDERSAPESE